MASALRRRARYALLLVPASCILRTDTALDPARCDAAADPQKFCQDAFGEGYSCLPSLHSKRPWRLCISGCPEPTVIPAHLLQPCSRS